MNIVYLHGLEARHTGEKVDWLKSKFDQVWAPQMDYRNPKLYKETFNEIKKLKPDYIIGSSMGGWFAFLIGSQLGIPTILFNPALQNRSFDPKVDMTGMKSGIHNIFFGKNDDVVIPSETQETLKSKKGKFNIDWYNGGHRVPFDIFRDSIKKTTGIMEKRILPTYEQYLIEKKEDFEDKIKDHGYFKGLSTSTARKKAAQMKKQADMDDDNPDAYKPMPGSTKGKKLLKKSQHTKDYHELYGDDTDESVNESMFEILTLLGSGIVSVFSLLQIFAATAYIRNRNNFKGAELRYNDLLAAWSPKDFIKAWKLVKRDKRILDIVNRLHNDPEIKDFLKNPNKRGWKKMLSNKLDAKEMDVIDNIYRRHFHEDGPKMTAESYDVILQEGVMSDLHIMIDDAKDFKDFEKRFYKEYGDRMKKSKDTSDWLEDLYNDTLSESAILEKATGDRSPIDSDKIETALKKKEEETGIPLSLLRIIMRRGMAAWKSGHRPGAGQEQWGYARISSFATKSPGTWGRPIDDPKPKTGNAAGADADVAQEVIKGGHDKKLKKK